MTYTMIQILLTPHIYPKKELKSLQWSTRPTQLSPRFLPFPALLLLLQSHWQLYFFSTPGNLLPRSCFCPECSSLRYPHGLLCYFSMRPTLPVCCIINHLLYKWYIAYYISNNLLYKLQPSPLAFLFLFLFPYLFYSIALSSSNILYYSIIYYII